MSEQSSIHQIIIVDDHPLFRQGIRLLLEKDPTLQVCAEAEDSSTALTVIVQNKPDLVLIDLNLQGGSGLDLINTIAAKKLGIKMLVVSAAEERLYGRRCLQAGAAGFISKLEVGEKLLEAIYKVLKGEVYLSPELSAELVTQALQKRSSHSSVGRNHDNLTDRELQVLTLYGQGLGTMEIAHELHLSDKTVATHRTNVMKKLGIVGMADLLQYALRHTESSGIRIVKKTG